MTEAAFSGLLDMDDEFDPLAVDDTEIDQENMDEDNPFDVVDFPTMRNMPPVLQRDAVYTPDRQGGAREATLALLDRNPARRPVLLAIIDWCREGGLSSVLSQKVDELQRDNRSVYAPMTLCRMLERAGALRLEMPEVSEEREDVEEGAQYLEIKECVDPIWHATEEGLEVYDELTGGAQFRSIVLDRDSLYRDVYRAVMEAVDETPRSKKEIEDIVDVFEVVQNPRRFGGHFIDMLERTDALVWNDHAWQLTDLGRALMPEVQAACVEGAENGEKGA